MKSIMKFAILVLQCAIVATAANADIPVVQHVVIIMQINRTPDNLFHGLPAQLPGADIANSGLNSKGQTIPLTAVALANTYDLSHRHSAFQDMYDNGRLDGADPAGNRASAEMKTPRDHSRGVSFTSPL